MLVLYNVCAALAIPIIIVQYSVYCTILMLVLYNVCAALATPLELSSYTYYQEREQRAANV